MRVSELMTTPVITCRESDTLDSAASMMWRRDCGTLPVVDDTEAIIGMITDRDICMAAFTRGRRLDEIPVAEIISGHVFSVAPRDSVERAEEIMRLRKVRRLPVVDQNDRIVGLLSLNDLARASARASARESALESARESARESALESARGESLRPKDVSSKGLVQTIAAVSEPSWDGVRSSVR